jgi:hypothetical protein
MSVLLSLQLDKRELVLQEDTYMLCADIRHGITVYLLLMSSAEAVEFATLRYSLIVSCWRRVYVQHCRGRRRGTK